MWIASTVPRSVIAVDVPGRASRMVVIPDRVAGPEPGPTRGSRRPGILWSMGERTIEAGATPSPRMADAEGTPSVRPADMDSTRSPRPADADSATDGLWSPARRALTIGLVLNV